jgi:hypothetical protein
MGRCRFCLQYVTAWLISLTGITAPRSILSSGRWSDLQLHVRPTQSFLSYVGTNHFLLGSSPGQTEARPMLGNYLTWVWPQFALGWIPTLLYGVSTSLNRPSGTLQCECTVHIESEASNYHSKMILSAKSLLSRKSRVECTTNSLFPTRSCAMIVLRVTSYALDSDDRPSL